MPTNAQIALALSKLSLSKEERLERGARLRREMHLEAQAGNVPTGYRYEWLNVSAREIISVLSVIAERFNESHSSDRVSVNDMIDILEMAIRALDMASGKG